MTWHAELVLIHGDADQGAAIVRQFWPRVIEILDEGGASIDVPDIDDQPLFHLRFYGYWDGLAGYTEVLRMDRGNVTTQVAHDLQLAAVDVGARCAAWRDWNATSHSRRLWTFLQACSILRVRGGMLDPRGLMTDAEGRLELLSPGRPWSASLAPWIEKMDADRPNEYAHWFAHLMSDRGLGPFGLRDVG